MSFNGFDSKANELFKNKLFLDFKEVENSERQNYILELKKNQPGIIIKKINLDLIACDLIINWENKNKHFGISGMIESGNKIKFEFEDRDDFSAVKTAYRNIANPHNEDEFGELVLYGSFTAYTQLRGLHTTDENYVKQPISYVSDKMKIAIPCNTLNGTLFTLNKDNTTRNIGCLPPWQKEYISGAFYKKIDLDFDKAEVFQSNSQPDCFYLIPKVYYLDRDDSENYKPTVDLVAQLNPDLGSENENVIILKFYAKPNLNRYDLAKLEQQLKTHSPTTKNGNLFPLLKFPNEFEKDISTSNIFDAKEEPLTSSSSNGYMLTFVLKNPIDLIKAGGLIPEVLKSSTGYQRELTYTLDEKSKSKSTFQLSFKHTTGNLLDYSIDKLNNNVLIANLSPLSVEIKGIFFYNKNKFDFLDLHLIEPLIINGAQQASIPFESICKPDISVLSKFENLEIDFIIQENIEDDINESRIAVDCLRANIVINTNIKPSLHNLSRIEVEGSISEVNMTLTSVLIPDNDEFNALKIPGFNLILPFTEAFRTPDKQVMDYIIKFYFNDNTIKQTQPAQINFGIHPSIFIAPDLIPN